jgi:hypothetical protein
MSKQSKIIKNNHVYAILIFCQIRKVSIRLKLSILNVSKPLSDHVVRVRIAAAVSVQRSYVLGRI